MAAIMRTDVGKVRKQNEDMAWFDESLGVFAVADGMGGHLAGEVASRLAIEAVKTMARGHAQAGITPLREAVVDANERIMEHAKTHPECSGMGTTLSVLWRGGNYVYIAHVGDSRIYRLRGKRLEQITQDHSLVEELVRAGIITQEEARVHPRRNIITRALGTGDDATPDLLAADTRKGDVWLLCTDGLNSMLTDQQIERRLNGFGLARTADALIGDALEAGGYDNVTLVIFRDEGGKTWNRG